METIHIERLGVVGLGFLGRGIATCLLGHAFPVAGYDRDPAMRSEALRHIEGGIGELTERARFPQELQRTWRERYLEADSFQALSGCDFVIESVTEDLEGKRTVLAEIEAVVRPGVPIASNTSALPISQLQAGLRHPERIVGMHWAEPAHLTRFLELVRGDQTSDAALDAALQLGLRIGKEPCLVQKDIPAFLINRIGYAMYREAAYLIDMGVADAETIDRAFRNAVGLWAVVCGPLRWMDLTGGPALYAKAMDGVLSSLCNSSELPASLRTRLADGDLGIKNGRGFYSYSQEEAQQWQEKFRKQVWRVRDELDEYFPIGGTSVQLDETDGTPP
jgi:3-hydroxybutyryl-CoA dehydrogenase